MGLGKSGRSRRVHDPRLKYTSWIEFKERHFLLIITTEAFFVSLLSLSLSLLFSGPLATNKSNHVVQYVQYHPNHRYSVYTNLQSEEQIPQEDLYGCFP
eukprot:scaffold16111_cov172-Amphora_coffeaeformis.AAC.1